MPSIFHVSAWSDLGSAVPGSRFVLNPGTQNAEGIGVYFSEDMPRMEASDSCYLRGHQAIVEIVAEASPEWWRTKSGIAKKFGRARTWHTRGKSLEIVVREIRMLDNLPVLVCDFTFC